MNEKFAKVLENIKKNQIKILLMKTSVNEITIPFRALKTQCTKWRGKSSDIEDKAFEVTKQKKAKREQLKRRKEFLIKYCVTLNNSLFVLFMLLREKRKKMSFRTCLN